MLHSVAGAAAAACLSPAWPQAIVAMHLDSAAGVKMPSAALPAGSIAAPRPKLEVERVV